MEVINAGAATISCANESGEPFGIDDEIVFASELVGETIRLRGEQLPTVTRPVSFVGPVEDDPGGMTLDGADASRILDFLGDAPNDFEVSLSHLTLTGGRTEMLGERGGAVRVENVDLTLNHVLVTGNRTEGIVEPDPPQPGISAGGGLSVEYGDVFLNNTVVSDNSTEGLYFSFGGGINLFRGDMNMMNSTVSGNSTVGSNAFAGGMFVEEGNLMMIGSTVSANSTSGAGAFGGGLMVGGGSPGSDNEYMTTIIDSTVTGNWTEGEHADGGGIVVANADAMLINSTVSGNSTKGESAAGGGLALTGGTFTLTHATVAVNAAAGGADAVHLDSPADRLILENSLIFQAGESELACNQGAENHIGSLVTDESCTGIAADMEAIGLAALADNGGATQTHSLDIGSIAINAAAEAFCTKFDQRGVPRPQGEACDIGAYEAEEVRGDVLFRDRFEPAQSVPPPD